MTTNLAICIAREFGSGGREIGLALAKKMGIAFYDKELLHEAAQKSGILQELFEKADEKPSNALAFPLSPGGIGKAHTYADYLGYLPNDRMQTVLTEVIREAADKSSCIIIGRCADYILRRNPNAFSVFIHSDVELRVGRIAHLHNLEEDRARNLVRKTDRSRANYYGYYTDREWNDVTNYDLSINSGRLSIENSVILINTAAELFANKK